MDTVEMDYVIDYIKTETECSDLTKRDLTAIAEQYYKQWVEDGKQATFSLYFELDNSVDDIQKEVSYYKAARSEYRYFSRRVIVNAVCNMPEEITDTIYKTYHGDKINFTIKTNGDLTPNGLSTIYIQSFGNRYNFEEVARYVRNAPDTNEKNGSINIAMNGFICQAIVNDDKDKTIEEWYNSEYSAKKNAELFMKNVL